MKRLGLLLLVLFSISLVSAQKPSTPQPGTPFNVENGKPVTVKPGSSVELVTPSGISIAITPGQSIEITIKESTTNPFNKNADGTFVGIFMTVNTNVTKPTFDATISIPYRGNAADVSNSQDLHLAYYNESTARWESVSTTVDDHAQVASAKVDHFSTWTLVESGSSFSLPISYGWVIMALVTLPIVKNKRLQL